MRGQLGTERPGSAASEVCRAPGGATTRLQLRAPLFAPTRPIALQSVVPDADATCERAQARSGQRQACSPATAKGAVRARGRCPQDHPTCHLQLPPGFPHRAAWLVHWKTSGTTWLLQVGEHAGGRAGAAYAQTASHMCLASGFTLDRGTSFHLQNSLGIVGKPSRCLAGMYSQARTEAA